MARGIREGLGVTVDLACPQCGTLFTVAATLVLDGGTAWCPGCSVLTDGDERARDALERLRRGHLAALRRASQWGHEVNDDSGG